MWTQRSLVTPPATNAAAATWDSSRQVLVFFGGRSPAGTAINTTWELSAVGWAQRTPPTLPAARYGHDLAYDPVRQRVILFGGFQSSSLPRLGDTWEWNGTNWTQVSPSVSPAPRSGHRMTWDPVRQHVVLFGGRSDSAGGAIYFADTWAYVSGAWTQLASVGPSAREGGSVAWDPGLSGGRVVAFGGLGSAGARNDTWAWDGTSWTVVATGTAPTARVFFDVAFHPGLGKLVLFGGATGGGAGATLNAETWVFDRTTWTLLGSASGPSPRSGVVVEWDPLRQKLMQFGGWNGTTSFDEHWEL
jgi:hypothetical protein